MALCCTAHATQHATEHAEIRNAEGEVLRRIELLAKRPPFLAKAGEIPVGTWCLQGTSPTKWAMSDLQLLQFFNYARRTGEYEAAQKARGYVCLYDINTLFVIPWSRGTGCGAALLMNAEAPLEAEVMISHAWAEAGLLLRNLN